MGASRKIALLIGGVLIVGGALFAFLYHPDTTPAPRPPPVRPAKTVLVQSAGQSVQRTFTGSVQAQDQADLAFRVSGPLIQLPVRSGDEVKAGALLAQVDPRDFRSREAKISGSLEEARAQLRAMKTGARPEDIRILENKVSAAKSEFDNAKVEMERYQKLFEGGTASKSELDAKKLAHDVSRDALSAARQDLEKGKKGAREEEIDAQQAQIRGLEAQLKEAQDALSDTSLRAPFDGVVAKRYVENFQDVRARERVLSLQNISDVKVVADLPEALVAMVRKEHIERITVSFDFDKATEYDVRVQEVELEADSRTRTYAVTVTMARPKEVRILPGMSASVRLYLSADFQARGGGIPVPADAVFTDPEGKAFVWTVQEPALTVHRKLVTPGDMSADHIIIRDGLQGGERIVTAGVHMLQEGWTIRLLDSDR